MSAVAPELSQVDDIDEIGDAVLDAIDDLVAALAVNAERIEQTLRQADDIREARSSGLSYRQIAVPRAEPLLRHATRNLAELADAARRLRRAEARALYAEGMTMEQIAALFGVTRQRVSAMLRGRPAGR